MKSHDIFKLTLLVIALVVIGAYLYIVSKDNYSIPQRWFVDQPGNLWKSCDNLSSFINSTIQKANYCKKDEDCIASDVGMLPCNCWSLMNKEAPLNHAPVLQSLSEYEKQQCSKGILCKPCNSKPMQNEVICRDNVCVTKNIATILYIPSVLHPLRESGIHSTERSDAEITTLFQKTNEIWKQAGIIFEATVEEARTIDNSTPLNMGVSPFMAPLVNAAKQNTVHVYFVRDLAGANGTIFARLRMK